jgi:flagellar hook protein FlgE
MAFDSLFVGVTGLQSYQEQIDVISNNIANVGTTGFKAQDVSFQDLFYQAQSYASAPTQTNGGIDGSQVGNGVKVGGISTNFTEGALQTTGVNTDLAINGNGFFVLNNTSGTGTPTYTRNGAFSLNQDGLLYDPTTGRAVMGFPANANGTVTTSSVPTPIQVPLGLQSQAVGTGFGAKTGPNGDQVFDVAFGGNLDQANYETAASSGGANVPLSTISTTIYDSLGNAHLVNITFTPAQPAADGGSGVPIGAQIPNTSDVLTKVGSEYQYTVSSTDGTTFAAGGNTGYIFFDQNGQFINTSSLANGVAAANVHIAGAQPNTTAGNQLVVSSWGAADGATTTTPGGAIGLDFANLSALAGSTTANTISQNGYPAGILSNISVGQDGTISGSFSNGQIVTLGQVALATFQNNQGLTRIGANQFVASADSGTPQIGTPSTGSLGSITAGALEESNVSIADEFTKMILAQRSFEANSRSITTADQDLQTIIGLGR